MPPWLKESLSTTTPISPWELFWRVGLAFVFGLVVMGIYRGTHRREPVSPTFPRTLVLLSILISMVTNVIGDNVARAFSLVGALSIVRFRTVVRDTQDTAFVIFAVVVGMAVGANQLWIALIGTATVTVAILLLRPRGRASIWAQEECNLSVRVNVGLKPETLVGPAFEKHLEQHEVLSVATAKQGTALEVTYRVRFRRQSAPLDLVKELNQVQGILGVEVIRDE
jgi:uncharacterized membrane protein YhiD involved in acid resistance